MQEKKRNFQNFKLVVSLKTIPVPTRSSLILDFFHFLHSFLLSSLLNAEPKQTKKWSDKKLRHYDLYRAGMIIFTMDDFTVLAL